MECLRTKSFPSLLPSSSLFQKELGGAACTVRVRETGRQGSQISKVWLCCWQRAPLHYSPPCLDPWEYFGITTHYIYILLSMVWSYSRGRAMRILHNDQCHFSHTYVYATLWLMKIFCSTKVWTSLIKFEKVWTSLDKFGQVWTSLNKFEWAEKILLILS